MMTCNEWVRLQANELSLFMLAWDNLGSIYGHSKYPEELSKEDWDHQFESFIGKFYESTKTEL